MRRSRAKASVFEEAAIYSSIEQLIGGEGNDTLIGNEEASTTLMGNVRAPTAWSAARRTTCSRVGLATTVATSSTTDADITADAAIHDGPGLYGMGGNDTLVGGSGADLPGGRLRRGCPDGWHRQRNTLDGW